MKVFIQFLLIFVVTLSIGVPEHLTLETNTEAVITFDLDTSEEAPLEHEPDEVETVETELFFVTNISPISSIGTRLQLIPHTCTLFDSYSPNIDLPPLV